MVAKWYWSRSGRKRLAIHEMHTSHILSAMAKLTDRFSPDTLQAMRAELISRGVSLPIRPVPRIPRTLANIFQGGNALSYNFINAGSPGYATIQAAIDAAPAYDASKITAGTIVWIPPGEYNETTVPAMTALTIPHGVTLAGAGLFSTVLRFSNTSNKNVDMIKVQGNNCSIQDLTIRGCNDVTGTGRGIVYGKAGSVLDGLNLSRVYTIETPGNGLRILGGDDAANTLSINSKIDNCKFSGSKVGGCVSIGNDVTTTNFINCYIQNTIGYCVLLQIGLDIEFDGCIFEGGTDDTDAFVRGQVAGGLRGVTLNECYFEHDNGGTNTHHFIELDGLAQGITISDCTFVRDNATTARILKTGTFGVRNLYLSRALGILSGVPSGTDDISTGSASDTIYVNMGATYKSDFTNEAALTSTGSGTVHVAQYT